jgi:hypothetical protein
LILSVGDFGKDEEGGNEVHKVILEGTEVLNDVLVREDTQGSDEKTHRVAQAVQTSLVRRQYLACSLDEHGVGRVRRRAARRLFVCSVEVDGAGNVEAPDVVDDGGELSEEAEEVWQTRVRRVVSKDNGEVVESSYRRSVQLLELRIVRLEAEATSDEIAVDLSREAIPTPDWLSNAHRVEPSLQPSSFPLCSGIIRLLRPISLRL